MANSHAIADCGKVWQGFWRLADPKISITSLACLTVGGAWVASHGELHWGWLAVTAAAMFAMEVAKNAWGDVIDFDSGTDLAVQPEDRTDFSGGKRVLVDQLLSRGQTWAIAAGFGGLGVALGIWLVVARAPEALWLGVVGLVLGWSYHGPPLRLCYRGLGELDVALCYGPLLVLATTVVQTNRYDAGAVWLSVPLGLFTAAFLLCNEFPDRRADAPAGKRNLVVRLGGRGASRLLGAVYVAGFAMIVLLPALGQPFLVWLALLPLPLAAWVTRQVSAEPDGFWRRAPVQPVALLVFVLYAALVAVGTVLG
jgi:1,4-dihydroxy-2-naphthoate octaprenyltransferase